jgi:hypothetical protein
MRQDWRARPPFVRDRQRSRQAQADGFPEILLGKSLNVPTGAHQTFPGTKFVSILRHQRRHALPMENFNGKGALLPVAP